MLEVLTQGFLFPNEIEVHWSLMIVLYPYITGLVAGAFIVSSLYHVFGREELKPVAKFSLVAAFSLSAVCLHAAAVSSRPSGAGVQYHVHPAIHVGHVRLRLYLHLLPDDCGS